MFKDEEATKLTTCQQERLEELRRGIERTDNFCNVPSHMHEVLLRYVVMRKKPGHFLTSVLENNLSEAVARADEQNQVALHKWIKLLHNYVPSECWGSEQNVERWLLEYDLPML